MKDDRVYWLGFSAFNGIGPKRFALRLVEGFLKFRKTFNPRSYFLRLREKKITFKILEDKDYPESLKKIDNPLFVLYIKGKLKQAKLAYKAADILDELNDETKHIDQIARESGFDTAKVASIMSFMEIKGKVRNLGGMVYIINR